MKNTIYLWNPEPPEGGESEPEEQTCSKCLELVEECACEFYDKVEEVELAHERAETAMSRLKPIDIEVRTISR